MNATLAQAPAPGSSTENPPAADSAAPLGSAAADGGTTPGAAATDSAKSDAAKSDAAKSDAAVGQASADQASADQASADQASADQTSADRTTASTQTPWYAEMTRAGAMGYMIEGGVFMWPILLLGVLAAAVIIERFRSLRMLRVDSTALRGQVFELLGQDRVEEAVALCDQKQGPVAAILSVGLKRFLMLRRLHHDAARIEQHVVRAMDDYGVHIMAALERHLPLLATVATVAPMIGFLGTVQGMVTAFTDIVASIGEKNIVEAAAAGIKVALLTTVFGLIVGIPAFMAFNYFTGVINRFVLEVQESATDLIEAVTLQMALTEPTGGPAVDASTPSPQDADS